MNGPEVLELGASVLQSDIRSVQARAAGISPPYPGFVGNVAQALRPWPQYQQINWRDAPIGKSVYHSLQVKLDRRFSSGMQFRLFYTWAKLMNNGAEIAVPRGSLRDGVQNPKDTQQAEWTLSIDDVPHSFVLAYTWELPIGKNLTGVAGTLAKGWTFNGIFRYESARPLTIGMTNDLAGLLFNGQKRPHRVAGSQGRVDIGLSEFDPNADRLLDRTAWQDPGPLQFGNAPRNDGTVRGFKNYVEDVSLFKETRIGERFTYRLEAQFGNFMNRTVFCGPNLNFSSDAFGRTATRCNIPRSIQFGMKLLF
jgi:hypothetical protein